MHSNVWIAVLTVMGGIGGAACAGGPGQLPDEITGDEETTGSAERSPRTDESREGSAQSPSTNGDRSGGEGADEAAVESTDAG